MVREADNSLVDSETVDLTKSDEQDKFIDDLVLSYFRSKPSGLDACLAARQYINEQKFEPCILNSLLAKLDLWTPRPTARS